MAKQISANEKLRDLAIIRQMSLLRLSETESKALVGIMRGADADIERRLSRFGSAKAGPTRARLAALREDLKKIIASQTGDVRSEVDTYLRGLTAAELESAEKTLGRTFANIAVSISAAPSVDHAVAAIRARPMQGIPVSRWITLLGRNDFDRAWATVMQGVTIGQTTEEMARAISGPGGIRDISRRSARTLARTLTIHASTTARESVWEANADIIQELQWVSTLDSRTTPICRGLDGETFPLNEGPRPPIHMNCRSIMVAVLKDADALGLDAPFRAAFDGRVSADLTYGEWLKTRSAAFQRETLGPTRAKLFRDGDLEIDRFVNFDTAKPFTLRELRRREPAAFREAGL